jgi:hypothetical protein
MTGPATWRHNESYLGRWVRAVGEVPIPLLAGFSVTSVLVVTNDSAKFRWSGPAILVLTIASVALIASVQCAYHARLYLSPQVEPPSSPRFSDRKGEVWAKGTQITYHCGIVALLAGLGLALAPLPGKGMANGFRWSATVIAFSSCLGEAAFIVVVRWLARGRKTDAS